MKKTIKRTLLVSVGIISTTSATILPLALNSKQKVVKPNNFFSIYNSDNSDSKNTPAIFDTNGQTITTKDNNLVVLRSDKITIYNRKGKIIYEIFNHNIKKLININTELSLMQMFEKNNQLFIIAGAKDIYDQPISSYIVVFDLENYIFKQILTNVDQPLNVIQSLSDQKVIFYNSRDQIKDLKSTTGVYVYDKQTNKFTSQTLNDFAWNNDDSKIKAYLLNIIQDNNKTFVRILEFNSENKQTKILLREVANETLASIANQDWQTLNVLENNSKVDYAFSKFDNGEKIFNIDYINTKYTKINNEKIVFINSNYKKFGIAVESFNPKTSQVNQATNFDFATFKQQTQFADNYKQSFTKDINNNSDRWIENGVFVNGLRILSIVPESENSLLLTTALLKEEPELTHGIFTKGRILRLTFENNMPKFLGLKNSDNTEYASWISESIKHWNNDTRILDQDQNYFYGFLNKIENDYYVTNGSSLKMYNAQINGEQANFEQITLEKELLSSDKKFKGNSQILASEYATTFDKNLITTDSNLISDVKLISNDVLGRVDVIYKYTENNSTYQSGFNITGFKILDVPIFTNNLDIELVGKDQLKTWKIDELTPNIIANLGIIKLKSDNPIRHKYIKINKISDIEVEILYEDPKIKENYPYLKNSHIYTNFKPQEHDEETKKRLEQPDPNNQSDVNQTTSTEEKNSNNESNNTTTSDKTSSTNDSNKPTINKEKQTNKMSNGAIAASVILPITGVGIIAGLIWFLLLKKRRKNKKYFK